LNLLKISYLKTTRELLKLCIAHDQSQSDGQGLGDLSSQTEMQNFHNKVLKKMKKLRTDKMNVGSLMRIVRSQKFEKLS
jgi:hypothetical protein